MPEPEIIQAYDAIAPHYAEYSSGRQAYLDAVDRLVIEQLEPGMRLLDIGSGDGRRLAKIIQAVGLTDVVAVEPSEPMAAICEAATGVQVYRELGEHIDRIDIGQFDVVTAMWNIFGHIPDAQKRLRTLINARDKLKPGGMMFLDINNRYNALAYGKWRVISRVILDSIYFKESRGDANFQWAIGEQSFNAFGHLFTPAEFEYLVAASDLIIEARRSVNYATGEVSRSRYRGQLFYRLRSRR